MFISILSCSSSESSKPSLSLCSSRAVKNLRIYLEDVDEVNKSLRLYIHSGSFLIAAVPTSNLLNRGQNEIVIFLSEKLESITVFPFMTA